MKNYLNTYKTYIIPCEYLEKRIEASLPLHKAELGSIPYYTSLIFIEVGYLIISIYNQTNSFFVGNTAQGGSITIFALLYPYHTNPFWFGLEL